MQDHSYQTEQTETHHMEKCECGSIIELEEHSHSIYQSCDRTKHYLFCECGYCLGLEAHVVPAGGPAHFKFCVMCGQQVDVKSANTASVNGINSSIRYITEAGSYVDEDGIIYLVESDMELYLAGELDVHALAEQSGDSVTH